MAQERSADRGRQVAVTLSYLVCLVGSMIGVGLFGGTPIADAAGGALDSAATPVAPASGAFSVWSVVYAGLAGYTVLQWFPVAQERQRQLRLPVAGSMLLNAAWILVVQAGLLWGSVLVIAALLALLGRIFVILTRTRPDGLLDRVLVDGTLGIYLGWVCVATVANIAAALAASGFGGAGLGPDGWAVAVLVVVAGLGVALAVRGGGRFAVGAAIAWGLTWIAVGRSSGELESAPAAWAAAAAAVVVLGATLVIGVRHRTVAAPAPR